MSTEPEREIDYILPFGRGTFNSESGDSTHIARIEVFSGDDEGGIVDSRAITSNDEGYLITRSLFRNEDLNLKEEIGKRRLRGEPGVRIHFEDEGGLKWTFSLCHAKGQIHCRVAKVKPLNKPGGITRIHIGEDLGDVKSAAK